MHCVVPGIKFLEGTQPEFTAPYDLRTADNGVGEGEPFEEPVLALLHQDGNLLSLAQLLRALQHYALAMNSTSGSSILCRRGWCRTIKQ